MYVVLTSLCRRPARFSISRYESSLQNCAKKRRVRDKYKMQLCECNKRVMMKEKQKWEIVTSQRTSLSKPVVVKGIEKKRDEAKERGEKGREERQRWWVDLHGGPSVQPHKSSRVVYRVIS